MSAERSTTASYFPLGYARALGQDIYAGLVLGQPGNVLVTRCLHPHRTADEARTCAADTAHVATLPGELQTEWLDRTNRPRLPPPVDTPENRERAHVNAARRRAEALRSLDDVHAYLTGSAK